MSDPKFNECLKDASQKAIPHLVKGKIHNVINSKYKYNF